MARKLSDEDLVHIARAEIQQAVGFSNGELSNQRRAALAAYYGEPQGDEQDLLSQYVSRDVLDVVEALMPQLMKVFVSSDEIARFEPQEVTDEDMAQEVTEYLNYVFFRQNPGFMLTYNAMKDGLIQKNGFIKFYWENLSTYKKTTYQGLTLDELAKVLGDEDTEVVSGDTYMGADGAPRYDVVVRNRKGIGKITLESVPPEEMLISRGATNNIQDAKFVGQRRKYMLSDLKEMGFDVTDLPTEMDDNLNQERISRFAVDEEIAFPHADTITTDESRREVWVHECYLHTDFDGDGIAELRKVTLCGTKLLLNEEVDMIPFASATPLPIPHKFFGMSVADLTMDLQLAKTFLTRQVMNNAAFTNFNMYEVMDGMVNLDDMGNPGPGRFVRVKAPGMVRPFPVQSLSNSIFNHIEYLDTVKEQRTGVTRYNQGMDANSLNKTAHGINSIMSASMERILMIARVYAETLFSQLFWGMLALMAKHETKSKMVRLTNRWVTLDPQIWKNKYDMTVTVGLGTGSHDTVVAGMNQVLAVQQAIAAHGLSNLVTPQNVYNAAMDLARAVMPKKANYYFSDPSMSPPPQPTPDPTIITTKMKIDAQTQQRDKKMQQDWQIKHLEMMKDLTVSAMDKAGNAAAVDKTLSHEQALAHLSHAQTMDKAAADFEAQKLQGGGNGADNGSDSTGG